MSLARATREQGARLARVPVREAVEGTGGVVTMVSERVCGRCQGGAMAGEACCGVRDDGRGAGCGCAFLLMIALAFGGAVVRLWEIMS